MYVKIKIMKKEKKKRKEREQTKKEKKTKAINNRKEIKMSFIPSNFIKYFTYQHNQHILRDRKMYVGTKGSNNNALELIKLGQGE